MKPENLESLQNILLYHVVPGSVKAEQVVTLENAETALGPKVSIKVEEGKVFVNDAEVIITDIQTYNAVSYTHLRAHETVLDLVCRLLLEKKKQTTNKKGELK